MTSSGHILKIVIDGKTFPQHVGIRCSPHQTYGVSQESPEEFKASNTLISDYGYIYHEQNNMKDTLFSQRKYCSVVGSTIDVVEEFKNTYHEEYQKVPEIFHRRKGRLSQFMDKNGWMSKVMPMMGIERSKQAREASNKDRERRIKSLNPKRIYNNPVKVKPFPKENLPSLFTEKAQVRNKRYSLGKAKQSEYSFEQRELTPSTDCFVEAESMMNKMASTLHDKEWRSTMSSIRNRYNKSELSSRMNVTISNWEKTHKYTIKQEEEKDQLKDWFNTTCNSHASKFKFRKPKKMATNSSEEVMND